MKILTFLTIQASIDRPKHDLENSIASELATLCASERHSINDIAQLVIARDLSQLVVKLHEVFPGHLVAADLEELHANLPRGRIELVEFLRRRNQRRLDIVRRLAVSHDDDVERLRGIRLRGIAAHVRLQDPVETLARRCSAARTHRLEDLAHDRRVGDVVVEGRIWVVQEVEVDAVGVVRGADWRDGFDGVAGFAPAAAGHAARVVDQEHCIEG